MDYFEAKHTFETKKKRKPKVKVAANTWIVKTTKGYGIKLYDTVILEFFSNGLIRLNTGGWNGRLTHSRMTEFLPECFSVSGGTSSYYKKPLRGESIIQHRVNKYPTKMAELLAVEEDWDWRTNVLKDGCILDPKDGYIDYSDCQEPEELEYVA